MALADIEKKIIQDAEKEAADVRAQAQREQSARLKKVRDEIAAERKRFQAELAVHIERSVDQKKHLLSMEAAQKYLQAKRGHLSAVFQEVRDELVKNERQRAALFKHLFRAVLPMLSGEQAVSVETSVANKDLIKEAFPESALKTHYTFHKEWDAGRCELQLTRARIDLSIDLFMKEQGRALEAWTAEQLFD